MILILAENQDVSTDKVCSWLNYFIMKLESLNQEKFEKIEKNELGMLVGGTCDYEETGAGSLDLGSGGICSYSNDWDNSEYDENGTTISGSNNLICGGDMKTAPQAPAPSTR